MKQSKYSFAEGFLATDAKIAKEKDCRLIFTDLTEVSRKLSILEIYELPDRIKTIFTSFGIHVSLYRRANLVAKDWDDYIFHENVMVNRGQNEKVFTDIDEATKWLLGKEGSTKPDVSSQSWVLPKREDTAKALATKKEKKK